MVGSNWAQGVPGIGCGCRGRVWSKRWEWASSGRPGPGSLGGTQAVTNPPSPLRLVDIQDGTDKKNQLIVNAMIRGNSELKLKLDIKIMGIKP